MKLIPTHQLQNEGLGKVEIRKLVSSGQLSRARRGLYFDGSPPGDPVEQHVTRLEAALELAGSHVVASHWSAAVLWRLPVATKYLEDLWLTAPGSAGGYTKSGIHKHKAGLAEGDVVEVGSIRATSLARTVSDLARKVQFQQGVVLADAALHSGLNPQELERQLAVAVGRKGVRRARAVAAFADGRAESPMESMTRIAIWRAGVPMPDLQRNIYSRTGEFLARADFCWEEEHLIGEYDGEGKYYLQAGQPTEAFAAEKIRDARLRDAGWSVVHWIKADLADEARFGRRLWASLRAARHMRVA